MNQLPFPPPLFLSLFLLSLSLSLSLSECFLKFHQSTLFILCLPKCRFSQLSLIQLTLHLYRRYFLRCSAVGFLSKMVNKRRYNSVERFTSIHLSEFEQRQQLRPAEQLSIGTGGQAADRIDLPNSMPSPSEQQQQMAHPFSLMRRRSHEQLQSPIGTNSKVSADNSPQALLLQRQIDKVAPYNQQNSIAPSVVSNCPPYSQRMFLQKTVQSPSTRPTAHSLYPQYGRSPQQNSINDSQSVFVPPSLAPLQIRPQQSPRDIQSIQKVPVPRGNDFESANITTTNKIPAPVWATLSVLEVIAGIVSLFVGALNASPYNCMVEPNIPIYLILSGLFLILNGGTRIFLGISASSTKTPKRRRTRQIIAEQRKPTSRPMFAYAVEGIGLFAILVVVILGSVWVYGASRYMHSQSYMFERHFCGHTLYWVAWWSVTIHLALFALLILLGIVVLVYGAIPGIK